MKEKMLVLGIAEPYVSTKYEIAVCVAGITIHGEFRRIYSIPLRDYYRNPFKKFQYIQYDVLGKGSDFRPESRKIDVRSIEPLQFSSVSSIAQKIQETKSFSLEYLHERTRRSLGIVQPRIEDFQIEYRDYPRTAKYSRLRTGRTTMNILPFWVRFDFCCRARCPHHWVMCEDMEIGNYYRRLLNRMHGRETPRKVEKRMKDFLDETTPYFLMGTHRRYKNVWLIISIINPQGKHFY